MKISITGLGIVSGIGNDLEENKRSLQNVKSGIKFSQHLQRYVSEVELSNTQLREELGIVQESISRTSLLALKASREALGTDFFSSELQTGIISSTSLGGLDKMEAIYFESVHDQLSKNRESLVYENGECAEFLAQQLGISGFIDTISTACSSSANAILYGARLIEAGVLDRVLVGGVDPITLFNINGFSSLNIYSSEPCKPFDINRNGLTLGEGAAFLVLENDKSIKLTKKDPLCYLTGWANATDAYHQTASSPDGIGASLTMREAIGMSSISPSQIDYINVHGTGTQNNDQSELNALINVFGDKIPHYSSTKGFTGHTLAAAGGVEAIYSILSLLEQCAWPSLGCETPFDEQRPPILNTPLQKEINYVLSNSFGFGGNCTSLVFSRS